MSDLKEKLKPLCKMGDVVVEALHGELDRGIECVDSKEVGEVADIIKDLAQTQKYLCEAEYYKTVIDAMHENEEYKPYVDQEPYIRKHLDNARFNSEYGRAYDEYESAKRHYTQTHSVEDRNKMDKYADEHISKAIDSIKEMWDDADPMLREEIKDNLSELLKEMA